MISVRIESIYAVGLAKILMDSGEPLQLISPNEELQKVLGVEDRVDTLDVHIGDISDRFGLQLKGSAEHVDKILDILRSKLPDSLVFRHELQQDAIYFAIVDNFLPRKRVGFLDLGDGQTGVMFSSRLRQGARLIVQVKELPMEEGKFPVVSDQINLAGQYVILEKGEDGEFVRVSKKIVGEMRDRMHELGHRIRPEGFGLILRTSAPEADEDTLRSEVEYLKAIWDRAMAAKREGVPKKITSGEALATLILHHGTKQRLDEIRSTVQEVMPKYHSFKSYSVASGFAVDYMLNFLSKVDRMEAKEVLEEMILSRDYQLDHPLRAEFHKVDGRQLDPILGLIKVNHGRFELQKNLDEYLASNDDSQFVVYEGDYIRTYFAEGSWTIHYRYYSGEDDHLIGDRVQIVTPVELAFRGRIRTVDFGINVYRDGETGAIDVITDNDDDLLSEGIITSELDIKLGEVIEKVLAQLRKPSELEPVIVRD